MALRTQAGIGCLRPFTVYPAKTGLQAIAFSRLNSKLQFLLPMDQDSEWTVHGSSRHGGTSGYRLQQIKFEITIHVIPESELRVDSLLI